MDKITIFIGLVFVHYIFDGIFQSYYQATRKSKELKALISHSAWYTLAFIVPFYIFGINFGWLLGLFLLHILLDKRNFLVWIMKNIKGMTLENTPEHMYTLVLITIDQIFHLLILWIIALS